MSEIYSAILTATVLPSDCTDEVIWESNDTTIATVTPIANTNTATVTALKAGSCTITVTCGDYSDSCNVTVQGAGPTPLTSITLDNGYYIELNYVPNVDTKCEMECVTTQGRWGTLFGVDDYFKVMWPNIANRLRITFNAGDGGYQEWTNYTSPATVHIIADKNSHAGWINDERKETSLSGNTPKDINLLVGAGYSSAGAIETPPSGFSVTISTFKIYESDALIHNFVPSSLNGVEGLYDSIDKVFYAKKKN